MSHLLKALLFIFLSINVFALEISLQGAKENHQSYSTLHLSDKDKFLCQEFRDDFNSVVKIVCAFPKSPAQKIQKLQNSFFEIDSEIKKETFFLVIKPFEKMKLFPIVFNLVKEDTVFSAKVELSNRWMIVGYKDKLPYIEAQEKSDAAINFPFTLGEDKFPYVGSLDIEGNPVHIKRVGDVTEYIKIKKLYEEKNYEFTLELINDIMKEYPDTLFKPELLFYKIRVHSKMDENEKLIEVAKDYLREYSSDENVPEVLSLLAKSYGKVGLSSDADYFYDRLFSEHSDSVYAKWGYIYLAESLEAAGNFSRPQTLYEKAIRETDNIEVAVEAAFRLAKIHMSSSKIKEAAEQVDKIAKAKADYFSEQKFKSLDMMYDFYDSGDYISATTIAKAIFEHIDPNDEEYEELSRNIGIWLSQSENKKEALEALNNYIERFSDGMYIQEVQVAKDSLFFDVNDENASSKLANYEKLMDEYAGDSIGDKAIYEKAKLLIAEGAFADALGMETKLLKLDTVEYSDIPTLITKAAIGTMKQSLKDKECNSVLVVSSKYKIELSAEWDDGVYECAMKGADFELAKKMADKNLKSKDLEQRKKWLYRYIKVDFATGNYSNVIEASKELITLTQSEVNSPYRDVYRYIFDTYHRLENSNNMIESIADVLKAYGDDYVDIDRYIAVMAVGSEKKDNNLVIEYGERVMSIQRISASHPQSPFVEFTLYQAYTDKENYDRALDVIKSLDTLELNSTQRARQKYLLGSVLAKLWRDDESQKAYQEAIDAEPASAWAKLAKSAKEI
ncbi:tetratricopeptide repeat protein [Sulfurimonas sp.]|uniref:tetratricopeptide repeat protein n=1 Tax=Sulfurimonas sp. TaxID=2022749 RepID=UPI0025FAC96F|nr:tetratricopeptide repeat protein [Sulfurimonas sp.]